MKYSIIAALLVLTTPAQASDPYKEGVRDYREGRCFHARPYVTTSNQTLEEALWIAGYEDAAMARDKKFRRQHRRYVEWPPKCHGPDNP